MILDIQTGQDRCIDVEGALYRFNEINLLKHDLLALYGSIGNEKWSATLSGYDRTSCSICLFHRKDWPSHDDKYKLGAVFNAVSHLTLLALGWEADLSCGPIDTLIKSYFRDSRIDCILTPVTTFVPVDMKREIQSFGTIYLLKRN